MIHDAAHRDTFGTAGEVYRYRDVDLLLEVYGEQVGVQIGTGDRVALNLLHEHLAPVEVTTTGHFQIEERVDPSAGILNQLIERTRIQADRHRRCIAAVTNRRDAIRRPYLAGGAFSRYVA